MTASSNYNLNPLLQSQHLIRDDSLDKLFRGTVTALGVNELYIHRDGSVTVEGPYPTLEGNTAIVGDEVVVGRLGTGYVVLGRIIRSTLVARPLIPMNFAEVNVQQTTTNVALQDIPGLSVTLTLYRLAQVAVVLTFDSELASGGTCLGAVAINMHGADHAEHQQTAGIVADHQVGAVTHAHDTPFSPGVYTIYGRFRRVSGSGTFAIDRCALLAWALPA